MNFDFSDHIVLIVVVYMVPCVLEVHDLLMNGAKHGDAAGEIGKDWMSTNLSSHFKKVPLAIAIVQFCVGLRQILFTCMFFHTPSENIVGFFVAIVVPLCIIMFPRSVILR
jgi:hypothetical protein